MRQVWDVVEPMLAVFVLAGVGWVVAEILQLVLRIAVRRMDSDNGARVFFSGIVRRAHLPMQVLLTLVGARVGLVLSPGVDGWRPAVLHALLIAIIVNSGWLLTGAVQALADTVKSRFRIDVPDNLEARRAHTQVTVLRRLGVSVIAVLTLALSLTTFEQVRHVGATVLASAGVAGVIAGLAAQSMLSNVFAGLQLVFGNALHIDDVVVVEGEWGRVETMTLSYVAVQIWDDRRLILPTSYFTSKPFQNWTRTHAALLGTVEFDVDWAVPIQAARDEMRRLVAASHLWDRRVCVLQVTDATGGLIRLRALVSASDAGRLWDLRCQLREQMVVWLRTYQPAALPRTRTALYGVGGARPLPDAPARKGDAGRAHRRATERDTERARVFGGSVDGYARGAFFVGPHSSVHYE